MAGISYSGGGGLNPTNNYIPYRSGGKFLDSPYLVTGTSFGSTKLGDFAGFYGDSQYSQYYIGEESGGYIYMDSQSKVLVITSDVIQLNGTLTAATAGGSAGEHLVLTINGNSRKIALLLP